jgi:hypothetical protein
VDPLLLDRVAEVAERGVAEAVHVQQEVVEVDPFRASEGSGSAHRTRVGSRFGVVPRQRLGVMLAIRAVVLPSDGSDERRVDRIDRIEDRALEGRSGQRPLRPRSGRSDAEDRSR